MAERPVVRTRSKRPAVQGEKGHTGLQLLQDLLSVPTRFAKGWRCQEGGAGFEILKMERMHASFRYHPEKRKTVTTSKSYQSLHGGSIRSGHMFQNGLASQLFTHIIYYNVGSWLVWGPPQNNIWTFFKVESQKNSSQEKSKSSLK